MKKLFFCILLAAVLASGGKRDIQAITLWAGNITDEMKKTSLSLSSHIKEVSPDWRIYPREGFENVYQIIGRPHLMLVKSDVSHPSEPGILLSSLELPESFKSACVTLIPKEEAVRLLSNLMHVPDIFIWKENFFVMHSTLKTGGCDSFNITFFKSLSDEIITESIYQTLHQLVLEENLQIERIIPTIYGSHEGERAQEHKMLERIQQIFSSTPVSSDVNATSTR